MKNNYEVYFEHFSGHICYLDQEECKKFLNFYMGEIKTTPSVYVV